MWDCGKETETTGHFFLHCPFFANERKQLLNGLYKRHPSLQNFNAKSVIDILLHESDKFNESEHKEILLHTVNYIKSTKCFERPLIDQC